MKITKELWNEITKLCWSPCKHSAEVFGKDVCMGFCPFCAMDKGVKYLAEKGHLASLEEAFTDIEKKSLIH